MDDCHERLRRSGWLWAFRDARARGDFSAMRQILESAGFSEGEIESVLGSTGAFMESAEAHHPREPLWRSLFGLALVGLLSGVVGGGVFVFFSLGLDRVIRRHGLFGRTHGYGLNHHTHRLWEIWKNDFRSIDEGVYRPFMWGFAVGAVLGILVAVRLWAQLVKYQRRERSE